MQVDVLAKLADLEQRVWELEHPVEQYVIWTPGYQTKQHEIVRFDVTGDGELDLCQYNGGRSYTALSIGKIEGWNMLSRELEIVATITRDADGNFVIVLLPALPKKWAVHGSFRGLCARGGWIVDCEWSDGRPLAVTLRPGPHAVAAPPRVRFGGKPLKPGGDSPIRILSGKNTKE
jgi:hypothetical protein